ncbi:MAG: NADH-quinone oxidoreductase subunit J [Armatimonadota bacterium]|jgi:NADH-quinone oxidoreductase subunit J
MSLVEWASAPQFVIVTIASLLAVVSAMMMVTRRDVVRGALWLVMTLIAVAVLFVTLAADLIAVVQVLVYVGAVVVLFLFVIMLLAAGKEPASLRNAGPGRWASVAVAFGLLCLFVAAGFSGDLPQLQWGQAPTAPPPARPSPTQGDVIASAHPFGSPANVGQALFSAENVLTLEVISILLIAAMVGVMVLAKGLRYDSQAGDTEGEREA